MPRLRSKVTLPSEIKFIEDVVTCEEAHDGQHLVRPTVWPPPRIGSLTGDPSLSLRCVRCTAHVIVYAGHATGRLGGVTVELPEKKKLG